MAAFQVGIHTHLVWYFFFIQPPGMQMIREIDGIIFVKIPTDTIPAYKSTSCHAEPISPPTCLRKQ